MPLTTERKAELVGKFRRAAADTGSTEVQIALLSERLTGLTRTSPRTRATTPRGAAC
jgi:small subunit ribosomal protein S15